MNFATLDDSLIFDKSLFVYSHALILSNDEIFVKVYFGNNKEIYSHETDLIEFIKRNGEGFNLYACNHYKQYETIWNELVFQNYDKKLPKLITKQFLNTHNLAKKIAKEKFNNLKLKIV